MAVAITKRCEHTPRYVVDDIDKEEL